MANNSPNLFGESVDKNETRRRSTALSSFFTAYNASLTDERLFAYLRGLQDLTPANFNRAIDASLRLHNSSFAPSPGEMRDYLARDKERDPAPRSRANSLCPDCEGVGWRVEGKGYGAQAVRCECVKKAAVA